MVGGIRAPIESHLKVSVGYTAITTKLRCRCQATCADAIEATRKGAGRGIGEKELSRRDLCCRPETFPGRQIRRCPHAIGCVRVAIVGQDACSVGAEAETGNCG